MTWLDVSDVKRKVVDEVNGSKGSNTKVESETIAVSPSEEMVVSAKKVNWYGDPSTSKVKPTVFGLFVSKSKNRTMNFWQQSYSLCWNWNQNLRTYWIGQDDGGILILARRRRGEFHFFEKKHELWFFQCFPWIIVWKQGIQFIIFILSRRTINSSIKNTDKNITLIKKPVHDFLSIMNWV